MGAAKSYSSVSFRRRNANGSDDLGSFNPLALLINDDFPLPN